VSTDRDSREFWRSVRAVVKVTRKMPRWMFAGVVIDGRHFEYGYIPPFKARATARRKP
jgi:hypothetical protein